jgi:hypothetical protein
MRAQDSRRDRTVNTCKARPTRSLLAMAFTLALGPATVAHAIPSLPAIVERHGPAVVRLVDQSGAQLGQGFFVATDGTLLATLPGAHVGLSLVVETPMAGRVLGRVVALEGVLVVVHVALLPEHPPPVSLPLARVDQQTPEWVVGVSVDDTGTRVAALGGPRAGARVPTYDLPCPPGAPILTTTGEVVGIVLEMHGRSRIVSASAAQMRALVERAGPRHP